MTEQQNVCKGSIHLGTGCKRCSKCAEELTKEVERAAHTIQMLQTNRSLLQAQIEELELEVENLQRDQNIWPEWAKSLKKIIRKHTGYDGYDDWDGVDLPEECEEALDEYASLIDRLNAEREVLRTTNAAQAEQLAELRSMNTVLLEQNGRMSQQLALLQSIPPEPQAGVELTEDARDYGPALNDASWAAVEAWNPEVMGPMNGAIFNNIKGVIRAAILKYCEALNQRQAVKAEPHGYLLKGRQFPDHMFFPASHKPTDIDNFIPLYAEPLSANGTPPEGYVLVPIEPTAEMVSAMAVEEATGKINGMATLGMAGACLAYEAMLAAAPDVQDAERK